MNDIIENSFKNSLSGIALNFIKAKTAIDHKNYIEAKRLIDLSVEEAKKLKGFDVRFLDQVIQKLNETIENGG